MNVETPETVESPVESYERNGFAIFRNIISPDLIAESLMHIEWLMKRYPDLRPEHFHHPLMRDDAFWVNLIINEKILDVVEMFLGPDIYCFTSHYICKPPVDGHAVLWHQDGSYWKLEPMRALAVWVAIDDSTTENGCLWMIPGSHKLPLRGIQVRQDTANMLGSIVDLDGIDCDLSLVDTSRAVPVELRSGDASVHHPLILHHSLPNRSNKRRCGLDSGYSDAAVRISNKGLYQDPVFCRGTPQPGVNQYRAWPAYDPATSIPFNGHETWNKRVAEHTRPHYKAASPADEPVYNLVTRMIHRIQQGTVNE